MEGLAEGERPQERLERLGAEALSDAELIAVLLRKGSHRCDVITLANQLMQEAGNLGGLLGWEGKQFQEFEGIGPTKSTQLLAVFEMARRLLQRSQDVRPVLDCPDKVASFLRPRTEGLHVEKFWVLSLNRKNRLITARAVTSGTANASLVHPREVFREAIGANSSAIICAHNHPSGDPAPSQADIRVTRQLRDSAKILQIDLLDHVIIGLPEHDPQMTGHYSFAEGGII